MDAVLAQLCSLIDLIDACDMHHAFCAEVFDYMDILDYSVRTVRRKINEEIVSSVITEGADQVQHHDLRVLIDFSEMVVRHHNVRCSFIGMNVTLQFFKDVYEIAKDKFSKKMKEDYRKNQRLIEHATLLELNIIGVVKARIKSFL